MDDNNKTKLNWKRIIDDIPEVHQIIANGDLSWVKQSKSDLFPVPQKDFDKQSFLENFSEADVEVDKLLFEENDKVDLVLKAIKIM